MKSHKSLSIIWIVFICTSIFVPLIRPNGVSTNDVDSTNSNNLVDSNLDHETSMNIDSDGNEQDKVVEMEQSSLIEDTTDYISHSEIRNKDSYEGDSSHSFSVDEDFFGNKSYNLDTSDTIGSPDIHDASFDIT
ncbi:MAG: hypothetical protein ACTSRU_02860, partial [Candidatus Hodarchaeales archaeon]